MPKDKKTKIVEKVSDEILEIRVKIKEMENKKRESAMKKAPVDIAPKEKRMSFDAWWVLRSSNIPRHHKKEVILADFIGRGLKSEELLDVYDAALKKYGL